MKSADLNCIYFGIAFSGLKSDLDYSIGRSFEPCQLEFLYISGQPRSIYAVGSLLVYVWVECWHHSISVIQLIPVENVYARCCFGDILVVYYERSVLKLLPLLGFVIHIGIVVAAAILCWNSF